MLLAVAAVLAFAILPVKVRDSDEIPTTPGMAGDRPEKDEKREAMAPWSFRRALPNTAYPMHCLQKSEGKGE